MPGLTGKTALVTGASRGIGRSIAEALAAGGARVAVHYIQSESEAHAVATAIGGFPVQADLADPTSIRRLFAQVLSHFGRLDILVNNAATAAFQPVLEVTEADYDRMFAINAKGVFVALQEAARSMADDGRIINLSSGATVASPANSALYCGAKAAVEQFTRVLARELGPRRITVNTVSPGFTETDMLRQFPALVEAGPAQSVFGRLGTPQDVAAVVAFLASPAAAWITGQNLQVGGGVSMV